MEIAESLFVITVVIAITELVKLLNARIFDRALVIVLAGIVGAIAGAFNIEGLNVATGLMSGLSAAGIVRSLQFVGSHR